MYENHYGYIDKNGKTVIPFQYDHAWPFNKYGVAVVKDQFGSYLIDLDGKTIPGLDRYNFSHYYDYEERFIEITFREDQSDEPLTGAYDTKLRHVLLQPSVESIECEDDEIIRVYEYTDEECSEDIPQYFLNWKGERVYDWVTGNGFSHIDKPNINGVSIVSMRKYTELPENAVSYILHNGKKCSVKKQYGLFNSKKEFILPIGWDYIVELTDTIYACSKNGVYTIIEIESSDC